MVAINAPPHTRSHAFNFSLALVEALGHAGMAVVPMQPTSDMIEAGAKAGGISNAAAVKVYAAMIALET